METFVRWGTSVLRVVGHLNPVLSAPSSQSLELSLILSAALVPLVNTALIVEPHSPQVRGYTSQACLMKIKGQS